MSLTRRGIIAMLGMAGGAAAAPAAVGAKAAAVMLGAQQAFVTNEAFAPSLTGSDGWWGSPIQIGFEATRESKSDHHRHRYAYMKSWGQGFRDTVIRRELMVEHLFYEKMMRDEEFMKKIMKAFGE